MKRATPLILCLSLLVAVLQPPMATGTVFNIGSTYIGGSAVERFPLAAQLANGNSVVAFTTSSQALPTTAGAYMAGRQGGRDGYVEIRTPLGVLVAATYFGTTDDDDVRSLCVTSDETVIVSYATQKTIATTSAIVLSSPTEEYTVVLRLPATLRPPLSSVRLESNKPIAIASCAQRANGELWFVGSTEDGALSVTTTAAQNTLKGEYDCYVLGMDVGLTGLQYATYLGSKEKDVAVSILARTDSSMVVVWKTRGDDKPTTSSCTRLKGSGALDWTATISGSDTVDVQCATLMANQDVVLGGRTTSTSLPASSIGHKPAAMGGGDGFLSLIALNGNIRASTFVGTSASDIVSTVGRMFDGSIVAGLTTTGSDVVSIDAWQGQNNGAEDVLACVYGSTLSTLRFSSFTGGSGSDAAAWIAVDSSDAFSIVLWTTSSDLTMPPTATRRNPPMIDLPDNAIVRASPRDTISVTPMIINMDTVVVGGTAQRSFYIRNHSRFHTVRVSSISTTNSGKQLVIAPMAPWPLLPDGDSVVRITWKPTTAGVYVDSIVENVGSQRFVVVVSGVAIDSTKPPPPLKPRIAMEDVKLDSIRVGDSVHTPLLIELLRGAFVAVDSARVVTDSLKCLITSFPQLVENKQTYADVLIRATSVGADSAIIQCWYADTSATAIIRWSGKDSSIITPLDMRILAPLSTACIVDNVDTMFVPIQNIGTRMAEVAVEIRDVQTDPHWILGPIVGTTVHFIDPGATDTIAYVILASELGEHGVECRLTSSDQTWKASHVLRSRLPQPGPSVANVNFSVVDIGHDSTRAATIRNMSALPLRIDSVRLQAKNVEFAQPFVGKRIEPGESDSVIIRYTPTDTVQMSGTLLWWSSTAVVATTNIQGRGRNKPSPDTMRAEIVLQADQTDSVSINTPTPVRMVVRSVGSKAAHLRSIANVGSSASVSLATLPPYRTLEPGDSVEFTVMITAQSYEDVAVQFEARADEDSALVVLTVPVRSRRDTVVPTTPVRVSMDGTPIRMKIGETRSLVVRLDVGYAWLTARAVTDVQMRVSYRNSVLALDSSSRTDVLRGTMRRTTRKSGLPVDTTVLATLVFTGCLGDDDASEVIIDSLELYAGALRIHYVNTSLATTVLIDDAWSGGPRHIQIDTSQAAISITPIPGTLPLVARLYHADKGGVLDVYDNTGNLTSSWTIAPTLPAEIVSVTIPAGLSSGTYTAVFHTGTSTAVQRFVVLH